MKATKVMTALVLGATGKTGKRVALQLLKRGQRIRVIVRSKESLPDEIKDHPNATLIEASVLDMSDSDLKNTIVGTDAIIQCLGHNMNFKGMYGKPYKLVRDVVERISTLMEDVEQSTKSKNLKFVLMSSVGVSNPFDTDDKRTFCEELVLSALRIILPPHRDNEEAAQLVSKIGKKRNIEWVVVRPNKLFEGEKLTKYEVTEKPHGPLFDGGQISRVNCAHFIVDLLLTDEIWKRWMYKFPVLLESFSGTNDSDKNFN